MTLQTPEAKKHQRKDFLSSSEPRWCPGCGDYSVFKSMTQVFSELDVPRERYLLVSGIGCSSRLPYYAETYGFHTIHGRAPTVALGAKMANPDLSVWVITGDGDALSIGGNHFMHLIRRNPDIKIILFNNQIYGLTKGQASPTSPKGIKTKTSPYGSLDTPVRPLTLAIASGVTFAARVTDTDGALTREVMHAAARHKGTAFIEVMVNCVIFNDGTFEAYTSKDTRSDTTMALRHGEPMVFGKAADKGIIIDGMTPKAVTLGDQATRERLVRHDAHNPDSTMAYMLSTWGGPDQPLPLGVFRQVEAPTYEQIVRGQEQEVTAKLGQGDLQKLLHAGELWKIDANGNPMQADHA